MNLLLTDLRLEGFTPKSGPAIGWPENSGPHQSGRGLAREVTIEYPQHQRGDVVHREPARWPRGETCLPASVSIEQKDPVPIMV
jgi:hypothetical protein